MDTWRKILQSSITTVAALRKHIECDNNALGEVIANFPMRINPYFLHLALTHGAPLARQVIPDPRELKDTTGIADPLGEEEHLKTPNLVHKYPDRALLLVTTRCAVYCRFCTRKRMVGTPAMEVTADTLAESYDYIRAHPEIKEILISGGDPLLLLDEQINEILRTLHHIPSVDIIRIGTRVPSVLPMRITPQLVAILKKYHPLYINTHFNHPAELTPDAQRACTLLADGGIPLGCQTVLLKGINDDEQTIVELLRGLLRLRIKPYYLFQADLTRGTDHFRTPTRTGIDIMRRLYGRMSGMALPTLALDGPCGVGKIPLTPHYISQSDNGLTFTTWNGKTGHYPEPVNSG